MWFTFYLNRGSIGCMKVVKVIKRVLLVLAAAVVFFLLSCTSAVLLLNYGPSDAAKEAFITYSEDKPLLDFISDTFLTDGDAR